jgi:hypothetical protein
MDEKNDAIHSQDFKRVTNSQYISNFVASRTDDGISFSLLL